MGSFCLDERVPFIIYGIGNRGRKIYWNLINSNHNVICFFDQNALPGQNLYGVPVLVLQKEENHDLDNVIIVALQNGAIHIKVVRDLIARGYSKILYLPMPTDEFHTQKEMRVLRKAYRDVLEDTWDSSVCIPTTELNNSGLQEELNNSLRNFSMNDGVVWCPADLIVTDFEQMLENSIRVRLFRFFDGKNDSIEAIEKIYKNYQLLGLDLLQGENFFIYISNRKELYNKFMVALNEGMDFFEESAPSASYQGGKFTIDGDGNHRSCFLYAKGLNRIPLILSKCDFLKWINEKYANIVMQKYSGDYLDKVFFLHPYGNYKMLSWYMDEQKTIRFMYKFLKKAYGFFWNRVSILLKIHQVSYLPIMLAINGCKLKVLLDGVNEDDLNDFFYLYNVENQSIKYLFRINEYEKYDVLVQDFQKDFDKQSICLSGLARYLILLNVPLDMQENIKGVYFGGYEVVLYEEYSCLAGIVAIVALQTTDIVMPCDESQQKYEN